MRKLLKFLKHYWIVLLEKLMIFLTKTLTSLSFLMIVYYFGYIVYYSVFYYSFSNIVAGCILLYTMIHLNKSL